MFEPQQGPVERRTLAPASGNTPHVVTKHGQTPAAAPVGDLCGALYLWHVFLGKRLQTDLVGRLWYTPRRGLQGQGPPLLVGRNMGAGNHGPPQRSAVSSGREPGGASPTWAPCQAPGRSRKASEQPDVSPEPMSPEPTLPARAPATSCQPSTRSFPPPGSSSARTWGCQGGRATPVRSVIRPA